MEDCSLEKFASQLKREDLLVESVEIWPQFICDWFIDGLSFVAPHRQHHRMRWLSLFRKDPRLTTCQKSSKTNGSRRNGTGQDTLTQFASKRDGTGKGTVTKSAGWEKQYRQKNLEKIRQQHQVAYQRYRERLQRDPDMEKDFLIRQRKTCWKWREKQKQKRETQSKVKALGSKQLTVVLTDCLKTPPPPTKKRFGLYGKLLQFVESWTQSDSLSTSNGGVCWCLGGNT